MAGALQSIGGIPLLFVGAVLVCFLPALYLPVSSVLLAGVGLVLSAGKIFIVRRLASVLPDFHHHNSRRRTYVQ